MIFTSFLLFFVASFSHLLLFKDIFSAAPLSNLGLFQTDVFEVLCLCPIECVQEISGNFFFLLTWTAMNEKCFLQFSIFSAAHNFLFTIFSANFPLLHFYLLFYFIIQWTSHQFQKFLFPQELISQSCSPNLAKCTFDPSGRWVCISYFSCISYISWCFSITFAIGNLYQLEQPFSLHF